MISKKKVFNDALPYKRSFAYVIDFILINLVIIYPFKNVFSDLPTSFELLSSSLTSRLILAFILILVLTILYFVVFEFLFAQTIGKMLWKIKVVSEGEHLKFNQVLVRNLSKFSLLILLIDCLGFLKGTRQRYLDILASTRVVDV